MAVQLHKWPGDGDELMAVAGAAHYQAAISGLAAGADGTFESRECIALLRPVDDNPHDPNAVMVLVEGIHVGYLPRKLALGFRAKLRDSGLGLVETLCDAQIEADDPKCDYEVYLDLPFLARRQGPPHWPDGKPQKSIPLPDGRTEHHMADGRVITVPAQASYRLDYLSTWVGAEPDETYEINVTFSGLSAEPGFVEVWNFDIDQLRNYAFHKIVRITDLRTGASGTGADVCEQFGGEMLE